MTENSIKTTSNPVLDIRETIYEETRPWGTFRRFTINTLSTVKILKVQPGQCLSKQTHEFRGEFWRIIGGSGIVEIDNKSISVNKGDEFFIPVGSIHRASADAEVLEILEIALGEFAEDDIQRMDDKYGRII